MTSFILTGSTPAENLENGRNALMNLGLGLNILALVLAVLFFAVVIVTLRKKTRG